MYISTSVYVNCIFGIALNISVYMDLFSDLASTLDVAFKFSSIDTVLQNTLVITSKFCLSIFFKFGS